MANVLLCAEFSEGAKPLSRLSDCAIELIAQGHAVHLLCRDIAMAHSMDEFAKVAIFPAPYFVGDARAEQQQHDAKPMHNYSSLLMTRGYAESSTLVPVLRSWLHVLATLDADCVFADGSPTALLAARLLRVPSVMIGQGFAVPPQTQPLATMSPWRQSSDGEVLVESNCYFEDQSLLSAVNSAIKNLAFHDVEFDTAQELFSDSAQWVVSLPELDHYGERGLPYVARWDVCKSFANPIWPPGPGDKVFIEMDMNTPHLTELLIQLTAIGEPVLAIIPNATDEFIRQYKADSLHIQRNKVQIEDVLKQCSTIINHGSHDFVYEVLLLGIPCILMPNGHESTLLCYRLAKQKLCFAGPAMVSKLNVVGLLSAARERGAEWKNAETLARKYADNSNLIRLHDLIAAKFSRH